MLESSLPATPKLPVSACIIVERRTGVGTLGAPPPPLPSLPSVTPAAVTAVEAWISESAILLPPPIISAYAARISSTVRGDKLSESSDS